MRCGNRNVKLMRIISLLIVITCVIVVVAALFVRKNITSSKLAEQKFGELARDYYENDFYKPKQPFGEKDYELKSALSCKEG